ncbi:MAG: hypothetical protein ACR2PW_04540 [Gammaproteobacteria bacterium]
MNGLDFEPMAGLQAICDVPENLTGQKGKDHIGSQLVEDKEQPYQNQHDSEIAHDEDQLHV